MHATSAVMVLLCNSAVQTAQSSQTRRHLGSHRIIGLSAVCVCVLCLVMQFPASVFFKYMSK